jgi:hypothetical protein
LSGSPTNALLEVASLFVDNLGWRMSASGVPVSRYPGEPVSAGQTSEWPRKNAVDFYGNAIPSDSIPTRILNATYQAAHYESVNPGALNAALRSDQRVIIEKFGEITFQYATGKGQQPGLSPTDPIIPAVMALLAPLMTQGTNPYGISGIVA